MKEGKFVVLAIDDDDDVLYALRIVLEKNGYTMAEARSAEMGIREFKKSQPDFILVDLMMESIDAGKNLVKELKFLGNSAPVYMLSSVGDELSGSVDVRELGLQGVFQKPIDNDVLLKTLERKLKKG
ncbi:response regulator [Salinispira pacifica]